MSGRYPASGGKRIELLRERGSGNMNPVFSLYRKFLKTSKIVCNNNEIKMSITKERMWIYHDVDYAVFVWRYKLGFVRI